MITFAFGFMWGVAWGTLMLVAWQRRRSRSRFIGMMRKFTVARRVAHQAGTALSADVESMFIQDLDVLYWSMCEEDRASFDIGAPRHWTRAA